MQPEVLQVRTSGHLLFMADTMNVALTTGRAGILPAETTGRAYLGLACSEFIRSRKLNSGQMQHIAREWELTWGDDGNETFDSIFIMVSKENLPQKIVLY